MNRNTVARTGQRSAAQARRLLADTHLASSVVTATTELQIRDQVRHAVAVEDFKLGNLVVFAGEHFAFVASKFVGRYYIVLERSGVWFCSSNDDRVAAAMVAKVETSILARGIAA